MNSNFLPHCVSLLAFVQVAIALDFGLMYVERKSSTIRISEMIYEEYRRMIKFFTDPATSALRRYRTTIESKHVLEIHDNLKRTKTKVETQTDDVMLLNVVRPLGVIAGLYGLFVLYFVCQMDMSEKNVDVFLVISQLTAVYMILLYVLHLVLPCPVYVILCALIYLIIVALGGLIAWKGWTWACITNVRLWFDCMVFLPYAPIVVFIFHAIGRYLCRIKSIWKMRTYTKAFNESLDSPK